MNKLGPNECIIVSKDCQKNLKMYFIYNSGCCDCSCILRCLDHPKFKRFRLLAGHFIFRVVLVAADIISDIATAVEFAARGDFYWGLLTGLLIIAPFLAKCILYLVSLKRCFKLTWSDEKYFGIRTIKKIEKIQGRVTFWLQELKLFWWHIPLLQPLRYVV
jgi:hypothetical protein